MAASDPCAAGTVAELPLVDYSLPRDEMAKQVHEALEQFGFMFLENSGQLEAIQELRAASLSFFRLPEDEKQSAGGQPGELRGYYRERSFNTHTALGQEGTPDCCSQFFMGDPGTGNRFPSDDYEAKVSAVYDGFTDIARRLTRAITDAYGLPSTWVDDEFEAPTTTVFKVLHYPPPPPEECKGLRMAPHFDIDALTVLYQDPGVPGGLQVNLDGEWQDVNAPPGTLVINVGEVLKFLSAGAVKCTEHRVVMPSLEQRASSERISMALFLAPRVDTMLKPYGSQTLVDNTPITMGTWFKNYLAKFQGARK